MCPDCCVKWCVPSAVYCDRGSSVCPACVDRVSIGCRFFLRLTRIFGIFFLRKNLWEFSSIVKKVQDLHFTSYILRYILRSISGTLHWIRYASGTPQGYASGTLQERFGKTTLRRSQGPLGVNACPIVGPVARPDKIISFRSCFFL